jgi:outer membrane receptor protein involved in Fe transport
VNQFSPKAGFIWTPFERTTIRGGYARYLGGVTFEQSFMLEPTQVAGINQALRSIIPEMVYGPTPASRADVLGLAIEHKLPTQTYLGASGELLYADAGRELGVFNFTGLPPFVPGATWEQFNFRERTLRLYANQLLGEEWSLGANYRLSHAESDSSIPAIPSAVSPFSRSRTEGLLQQVNLQLRFNHRCGFFSRFETLWNGQNNLGYTPDRPGDNFWQFNASAGYRFRRGQAEVQVGVLNLTDLDYRLNPLNTYLELPRERTFFASLFFRF